MTNVSSTIQVSTSSLDQFRAGYLAPDRLLELVRSNCIALVTLPVGVGKSFASDRLISSPVAYEQFDLIVYAAPTWRILRERSIVRGTATSPVPWELLLPRPAERCGSRDSLLRSLERAGCMAHGKETVCGPCPERTKSPVCPWPSRFERLRATRLILCTEQQLVLNRSLIAFLKLTTGATRVLVILDEAKLLDVDFEVSVSAENIIRFRDLLQKMTASGTLPEGIGRTWAHSLETLLMASDEALGDSHWSFPAALNSYAAAIQGEGIHRWGPRFRYLGYDLVQFTYSRGEDRWRDELGGIRFIGRPYLGDATLILSAHLRKEYVTHRLGLSRPLVAPFEDLQIRHPETRISNIKSRIGADSYFRKNHPQILDFFATVIAQNIRSGRTTVLVSKKSSKALCAEYLQDRLQKWGVRVQILHERLEGLGDPDPARIPMLHYGMVGINDFEHYQSCYCLNSFYISPVDFIRTLQGCEPTRFRVGVGIVTDSAGNRRVRLSEPDSSRAGLEQLGGVYLRKLEVDPVIQAAGRVRFITKPREVIFFQMHDLTPEVGEVVEFRSLEHAREKLGLPRAVELDRAPAVETLRAMTNTGMSLRAAAAKLGMDKETARRWLKSPIEILDRKNEPPCSPPAPRSRRAR